MKANIGKILFNGKKNVLWGAGKRGIDLLFSLIEKDIYVTCFCDSDTDKQAVRIYNKLVVTPQNVLDNSDEYNVIVTPIEKKQCNEIINILERAGVDRYILGEEIRTVISSLCINRECLYNLIRDSYTHKMIIYGKDDQAIRILKILEALDVKIEYMIDEIDQEYKLEEFHVKVKPLYSILNESAGSFKVVIPSAYDKESKVRLDELGLRIRKEYNFFEDYKMTIPRSSILDPNLGYSFCANNKTPGFVQFGDLEGYKIVTLGNSTTDAIRFPFKSWSQALYEKIELMGFKGCIICGGCIGYQTSQELVKLIRDVLPMKPDMVIDFSGYNDALISRVNPEHPFLHRYQIELFTKISRLNKYEKYGEQYLEDIDSPTFGLYSDLTSWEQYINNLKAMKGICDIFGIKFKSFLQPWLATKPVHSIQEREMIINYPGIFTDEYFNHLIEFYKNKSTIDSSYMTDLTHIFNQYDDIYIDRVHVNEIGNSIIADSIIEVIKEELKII